VKGCLENNLEGPSEESEARVEQAPVFIITSTFIWIREAACERKMVRETETLKTNENAR
ncbi:Hypothetical protein SMAX5B_004898, partial [Scophthalmus maximus]